MHSFMNEKYKKVIVGSRWRTVDRFVQVRSIENRSDGTWVQYGDYGNDRTYECLIDAFLQRFSEAPNESNTRRT
jgi:hypothetical protein